MDTKTARAILSEVAAGGWPVDDLPEDEEKLIAYAKDCVQDAKVALEEGMNNEHISAIIALGREGVTASPPVLSESADHTQHEETPPGEITFPSFENKNDDVVALTYPRRSSGGYSESDLRDIIPEEFPIPQNTTETNPVDMPVDVTDIGDKALRRLYSAFGSYSGRARWMLGVAQSNLSNATHLRDEAYRSEYNMHQRQAMSIGEKLAQGTLENLAKDSELYQEWNERVNKHNQEVTHWKALLDIYSGNVDRLSREWTMRTEEYERSR